MKQILSSILGESPHEEYNENKYSQTRFKAQREKREKAPQESAQVAKNKSYIEYTPSKNLDLYGENINKDETLPQPSTIGGWMVNSHLGTNTSAERQIKIEGVHPKERTTIAVSNPPSALGNTVAEFNAELFQTPFDQAQDMVHTGTLINTYTGEVSATFENDFPPPNREGGHAERENQAKQLRLIAASGNPRFTQPKREQENPLPAGDSGKISTERAIYAAGVVRKEGEERQARDAFFNRNGMAPTEAEMMRNPINYDGYNNRLRINPHLPFTQELDKKDWVSNSSQLPSNDNPRPQTRLHVDAFAGRVGLATTNLPEEKKIFSKVRSDTTQRNLESLNFTAPVEYSIQGGHVQGSMHVKESDSLIPPAHVQGNLEKTYGATTLTSESIMNTLRDSLVSNNTYNAMSHTHSPSAQVAEENVRPEIITSNNYNTTAQTYSPLAQVSEEHLKPEIIKSIEKRAQNFPHAPSASVSEFNKQREVVKQTHETRGNSSAGFSKTIHVSEVSRRPEKASDFALKPDSPPAQSMTANIGASQTKERPTWLHSAYNSETNQYNASQANIGEFLRNSASKKMGSESFHSNRAVPSWLAPSAHTESYELKSTEKCVENMHGEEGAKAAHASTSATNLSAERLTPAKVKPHTHVDASTAQVGNYQKSGPSLPAVEMLHGGHAEIGRKKEAGIVHVKSDRGRHDLYRKAHEKVGGDTGENPRLRFNPGERNWHAEVIISPTIHPHQGDQHLAERALQIRFPTPHKREPRKARTPKPNHKQRTGISRHLTDAPVTLCDDASH